MTLNEYQQHALETAIYPVFAASSVFAVSITNGR